MNPGEQVRCFFQSKHGGVWAKRSRLTAERDVQLGKAQLGDRDHQITVLGRDVSINHGSFYFYSIRN